MPYWRLSTYQQAILKVKSDGTRQDRRLTWQGYPDGGTGQFCHANPYRDRNPAPTVPYEKCEESIPQTPLLDRQNSLFGVRFEFLLCPLTQKLAEMALASRR